MKCQGKGDPDVTVRQALFPVEAPGPAHRAVSHVMYLKRQTFQESGMNAFCYANNAYCLLPYWKTLSRRQESISEECESLRRRLKFRHSAALNRTAHKQNSNRNSQQVSVLVHQLITFSDRGVWLRYIGFSDKKSIIGGYIGRSGGNYKLFI